LRIYRVEFKVAQGFIRFPGVETVYFRSSRGWAPRFGVLRLKATAPSSTVQEARL
jgi:hypothetical protein